MKVSNIISTEPLTVDYLINFNKQTLKQKQKVFKNEQDPDR